MCADSEGRTPLHWAVDRGHLNVTELLVGRNADVNAKVFINTAFNA
jgi:ankyrin repeat protein